MADLTGGKFMEVLMMLETSLLFFLIIGVVYVFIVINLMHGLLENRKTLNFGVF